MKYLFLSALAALMLFADIEACVTYNPDTGIYTVDPSGEKE